MPSSDPSSTEPVGKPDGSSLTPPKFPPGRWGPPDKDHLAERVDEFGGTDEDDVWLYEGAADPTFVQQETAFRKAHGQFWRRLRRLAEKRKHSETL